MDAHALGFVANLPPEYEVSRLTLFPDATLTDKEREERVQGLVRQNALATVFEIQKNLAHEAMDPATSVTQKISINEQMMKLAKVDGKKDEGRVAGAGAYQLVINIGGQPSAKFTGVTLDQASDAAV